MSLFLGKIHYWLFNKILWFEGLEDEIIKLAKEEELDTVTLSNEINTKYGGKLPNKPLEEMIDKGNIHGWLQEKIHSAEGRMAAWTSNIIKNDNDAFVKIENIYIGQGIKAAKEVKTEKIELKTAKDIYSSVNDYILDGMPCDRVNEVLISDEDRVEWKRRVCVHKEIWEKENLNVDDFYILRSLWIKAFVNTVNSDYEYIEQENGIKIIKKSM